MLGGVIGADAVRVGLVVVTRDTKFLQRKRPCPCAPAAPLVEVVHQAVVEGRLTPERIRRNRRRGTFGAPRHLLRLPGPGVLITHVIGEVCEFMTNSESAEHEAELRRAVIVSEIALMYDSAPPCIAVIPSGGKRPRGIAGNPKFRHVRRAAVVDYVYTTKPMAPVSSLGQQLAGGIEALLDPQQLWFGGVKSYRHAEIKDPGRGPGFSEGACSGGRFPAQHG